MKQVNFVAQVNTTSYGECATQFLRWMDKLGYRVNLFPITMQGIEADPEDHDLLRKCVENGKTFDGNAPSIRLWHAFDMAFRAGKGRSYAFTIFELDTFTENERCHLNSHDAVIVNSEWAKQVCVSNDINVPVYVVPLAVDSDLFHPNYHKSYLKRRNEDSTVFINVGKKELRKHDIILKCFEKAFSPNDNVELHMVWENRLLDQRNPAESKGWERAYKNSPLGGKITLYPWLPSQVDVASLLANADVGLFPSHAEGWNFGLMQAMACGLPVITTNYSAHTEYCNQYNSMLIDIDEVEPAYDGVWFFGQGNWAKFGPRQEEQLVEYMRQCHLRKQSCESMFNTEGFNMARKFTWENATKKLLEVL